MNMSKITMLMAAALIGAGLCAAEPADAPKNDGGKPSMRGGRRGPGGPGNMMERIQQTFQLNDEEKAALKKNEEAEKEQAKAIREKAQAEIKAILQKSFDEQTKTLKTAAARLTDEKAKARAEKMIEVMEQRRDQMLDMRAKRLLAGDRPMFGPRGGRGMGGENGDRPMRGGRGGRGGQPRTQQDRE